MLNLNLFFLIGLPGSGKSFYGKKLAAKSKAKIISTDEIREEIFGYEYNEDIKQRVFEEMISRTRHLISQNFNIILDTTFLNNEVNRNLFIKKINNSKTKLKIIAIVFKVNINICLIRDKQRKIDRQVGESRIREMKKEIILPNEIDGKMELINVKMESLPDKEFRNLDFVLPNNQKVNTRGSIIGQDQYKPDISIVNSRNEVVFCIESSSSGDRKATLAEILQAEKYANDHKAHIELLICLAGNSKNSPTPTTQREYLKPYFDFLVKCRNVENFGVEKIYLLNESDFLAFVASGKCILNEKFKKECLVLE